MAKTKTLEERFPNNGAFKPGETRANPDNHFSGREIEEVRSKYIKFSVFMESLNETLELGRHSNIEEFALRIRDLVIAANAGEEPLDRIPTKEELDNPNGF